MFEVIDVFAFISEPSCLFEPNFFDSLYFKVCAPLAVMGFLGDALRSTAEASSLNSS